VLVGLSGAFVTKITDDERISAEVSQQVSIAVESGIDFVSTDAIRTAAQEAGLDAATTDALVEDYQQAQLGSLKAGLLAAAFLALASLAFTRDLPHERPAGRTTDRARSGEVGSGTR